MGRYPPSSDLADGFAKFLGRGIAPLICLSPDTFESILWFAYSGVARQQGANFRFEPLDAAAFLVLGPLSSSRDSTLLKTPMALGKEPNLFIAS
jgi:hypothetical protein